MRKDSGPKGRTSSRLLRNAWDGPSETLRLILWEKKGQGLKEVLKGSKGRIEIFFVVGPEGGMSDEEVGEAGRRGSSNHLERES